MFSVFEKTAKNFGGMFRIALTQRYTRCCSERSGEGASITQHGESFRCHSSDDLKTNATARISIPVCRNVSSPPAMGRS